MNLDLIVNLVNKNLIKNNRNPLNDTETLVLQGILNNQTYLQIAQNADYSPRYITCVVAQNLLGKISQLTEKEVTKKTCPKILKSYALKELDRKSQQPPPYPNGLVPLNSKFYIERSPIEKQIECEISQPGTLVRIKAPKEMGKTSLLVRAIERAKNKGDRVVLINLKEWNNSILENIDKFLCCLCKTVAEQLKIPSKIKDYWDEDIGSKVSCTQYFDLYLLPQIDSPIILAIDELNVIFEHPQVASDFLPLLRCWYEKAKSSLLWQKLRQIVVHSTEIYVPLHLKQSPFNVGLPVGLNHFTLEQVENLADRYELIWTNATEAKQLMTLVAGHPLLIHVAIYYLKYKEISLNQLLETAPTPSGIYWDHLQRHQVNLEEEPKLLISLKKIVKASQPVSIEPIIAHKLTSMGLIKLQANKAQLSCKLYKEYFQNIFNS
ncbi:MAG: AAA-like domain-containing protein [Prochloraceae cyanobacterium]|nr:AAA-like domain-containing protein [Prochloraceae cyanobacterium]